MSVAAGGRCARTQRARSNQGTSCEHLKTKSIAPRIALPRYRARVPIGFELTRKATCRIRLRARMRLSSMQLPILPAGAKSIAEDPPTLRALYLLFGVLLAILPSRTLRRCAIR